MRTLRVLLLICTALAASGCYHAVIDTGRTPGAETIERKWAHSFLGGLVPPSVTETAEACPNGVARVETQHSFLNMVANFITAGIYSPMTIVVRCAGAADQGGEPDALSVVRQGADSGEQAIREAVRLSVESGRTVRVDLR